MIMILNGSPKRTEAQLCSSIYNMRVRCLFIVIVCLALFLPITALGEEAKENVLIQGLYEYNLRPGGNAEIVRYNGFEERVTIPKTLDGHPVTAIRDYAFSSFSEDYTLTAVTIPSQVTDLGANPFSECMALTRITVAADHPTMMVVDGALYDKRTNTLIAYPAAASAEHLTVAPGTRAIGDSAFANCRESSPWTCRRDSFPSANVRSWIVTP